MKSSFFSVLTKMVVGSLLGYGLGAAAVTAQPRPDVNEATSGSQQQILFQGGDFSFTDLMQLTNQLQNQGSGQLNGGSSIDDAVQDFRSRRQPLQIRPVPASGETVQEAEPEVPNP